MIKDQLKREPTNGQIESACYSLRHDFGLLTPEEQEHERSLVTVSWSAISSYISDHPLSNINIDPTEKQVSYVSEKLIKNHDKIDNSDINTLLFISKLLWRSILKEIMEPSYISKTIDKKTQSKWTTTILEIKK